MPEEPEEKTVPKAQESISNRTSVLLHPEAVRIALQQLVHIAHGNDYDVEPLKRFGNLLQSLADNPQLMQNALRDAVFDAVHHLHPRRRDVDIAYVVKALRVEAGLFRRDPSTWDPPELYGAIGVCSVLIAELELNN